MCIKNIFPVVECIKSWRPGQEVDFLHLQRGFNFDLNYTFEALCMTFIGNAAFKPLQEQVDGFWLLVVVISEEIEPGSV